MDSEKRKIVGEFTLFDDESTREKYTIMDKWEIVCDDARNDSMTTTEDMEVFLRWGKKYRITIEEIGILRRDLEKERTEKQEDMTGEIRGTGADHITLDEQWEEPQKPLFERLKESLEEGIAHAKGELTLKETEVERTSRCPDNT